MSSIQNAGGVYLKKNGPKLEVHIGPNHEERRILIDGQNWPCTAISLDMKVGEVVTATVTFMPGELDIVGSLEGAQLNKEQAGDHD